MYPVPAIRMPYPASRFPRPCPPDWGRASASACRDTTLEYVHQDHLTGTALVTDGTGSLVSNISYYPYGATRSGDVPTEQKFTGQRLDGTGLYYYNARYYDPLVGRFISADTIVPDPANPQSLNRYSYVLNNPLKYIDPSGHDQVILGLTAGVVFNTAHARITPRVGPPWRAWQIFSGGQFRLFEARIGTYCLKWPDSR